MNYNNFGFSTPRALALATVAGTTLLGVASGVFGTFSVTQLKGNTCTPGYGYASGYGYGYGYNCTPIVVSSGGGGGGGGGGNSAPLPTTPTPSPTTTPTPTTTPAPVVTIPDPKTIPNPTRLVTRAQFVKLLADAYGYTPMTTTKKFRDVNPKSVYKPYIDFGVAMGWINIRNTRFRPSDQITRGEAQKLINVIKGTAVADTVADSTRTITRAQAAKMISDAFSK